MYRTDSNDEQFNTFFQSLIESSKVNQRRFYVYMLFLFTILLIIYGLTDEKYLSNYNIDLIFINLGTTVDTFLNFTAYSILFFHIFIIESLIEHHKKTKAFFDLETNLIFNDKKEFYLYPFVFNDKGLYKQQGSLLNLTHLLSMLLLLFFPIINLYSLLLYYPNTIEVMVVLIFVFIFNFRWAIKYISIKKYIYRFFFILFFLISVFPFYYNYKFLIEKKYYDDLIKNDKGSEKGFSKYIDLLKEDSFFMIRKEFLNKKIASIHVKERVLNKFYFYNSDLENSFFDTSKIKNFEFNELNLNSNTYFNTDIINVEFFKTNWNKQDFRGKRLSIFTSLLKNNEYKFETLMKNITFYSDNIINNSTFDNLVMKDIKFHGKNIIKFSKFISNKYEDVEFSKVEFDNVVFIEGKMGMSDSLYNKKLQELLKERTYDKTRYNFFNEISKVNFFDEARLFNVTFEDITIENVIFNNTLFNKIKIEGNTLFRNVTFMYRGDIIPNETFFRSIKNCTNCKYVDFINKKILINDNGKIYPSSEKLESYGIKK